MKYSKVQLKLASKQFLFVFIILNAIKMNAFSQDQNLGSPLRYTQIENGIWNSINTNQYGVAATGFIGKDQYIGMCQADGPDGGPWQPIDGFKHTLCGQLYLPHQGLYKEHAGDDGDIDLYVFPDLPYQWLLNNTNGNDWQNGTVLGEVALKEPDGRIATDGFSYFESLPKSYLQNIGIYGAWVSDLAHNDKHPEIHPVEQMWQKKQISDRIAEFYLFTMHDNEGRFTTLDNFTPSDCSGLPWIRNPQVNYFYLPFEVSLIGSTIDYNIEQLSGNNINYENSPDIILRLLNNGRELITVKRPKAGFPFVTFHQLGMKDENTIRGYIIIRTSIAKLGPTRTNGAHVFLKVTRTYNLPVLPVANKEGVQK